jgi:DNA-binding NarL/FixJ family response regulator
VKILLKLKSRILCEGLQKLISEHLPESDVLKGFDDPGTSPPDIIVFDSYKLADEITKNYHEAKFLFIDSGLSDTDLACLLICHGVHGIVSCEQDQSLFIRALKTVNQGEIWLEQKQLQTVLREGRILPQKDSAKIMSAQDRKIITLITRGQKNAEIASELCLSEPTIKAHVSRIYKTLNVRNRSHLVTLALENGWSHT